MSFHVYVLNRIEKYLNFPSGLRRLDSCCTTSLNPSDILTKQLIHTVHPAENVECVVLLCAEIGDVGRAVGLLQNPAWQGSHELL